MTPPLFDVACFGEILWDVLPSGEKPGGAPMNVAYHLRQCGLSSALISRIGEDEYGERLLDVLRSRQLPVDFIQRDTSHPTGVVNATIGTNHEVTYDIVFPVAWDFIEYRNDLSSLVSQAHFFVFGSLGSRNKTSADTLSRLLEAAQIKVLDINIRPPHYDQPRLEQLLKKADILKLNEHELPLIAAWYNNARSFEDQVSSIQDKFQIKSIIVTRGGEGAFLNVNGTVYECPGIKVKVADTVGSGDAFLAGFLFKLYQNATPEECLSFANNLGAFIATQEGACPNYTISQITDIVATA